MRITFPITTPGWTHQLSAIGIVAALVLFAVHAPANDAGEQPSETTVQDLRHQVEAANLEYQKALAISDVGDRVAAFRKAEMAYASLLNRQQGADESIQFDAELFVNWGNSAVLSGKYGIAILAFRRALRSDPDHQKAKKNLAFVRSLLPAWTQANSQAKVGFDFFRIWKYWLKDASVHWIAAVAFTLGSVLLGISILKRSTAIGTFSLIPLLAWLVLIASTLAPSNIQEAQIAVFVAEESYAYTADSPNSSLSFDSAIPAGTEAKIVEERDQWTSVEFGDGKSGWVKNSCVARVEW